MQALEPDALRALYHFAPDGVLFTAPDGRVLAANPAACEILGRSEAEICALGRQGLTDHGDERWGPLLAERARTGRARGIARMVRGDGTLIEIEMSARIFVDADGERHTCTILRDASDRVRMEQELAAISNSLRELSITDELTGLRNRRGFAAIGRQLLELADRQRCSATLLFVDVDNMKELNDRHGHAAGDGALRAVALALGHVLRRADTVSRIGGDEFVGLAVGLQQPARETIERRIKAKLSDASTLAAVGRPIRVSIGWASRSPGEAKTLDDLVAEADRAMYRAKVVKQPSDWPAVPG
ncbi:MAG: diguanylate cyclase [Solirubrobacteraceae bacterium]